MDALLKLAFPLVICSVGGVEANVKAWKQEAGRAGPMQGMESESCHETRKG